MERLFNLVPATEHTTSGSQAQVMLQAYQERLLTGMVTISNHPENKVVLFLVEGSFLNGYQFASGGWQRVRQGDWNNGLGQGDCQMRIRPLPPDGIRFAKTYIESTGAAHKSSIPSSAVPTLFREWLTLPDMTIASLQWESAEGMIIFPGRSASPTPILYASRDHVATGVEALETILWHAETPCSATFRTSQRGTQASQEYFLSLAFVTMVDRLLARYVELAGRSLPALLAQEINVTARVQGWQMSVLGVHIYDRGVFSSPEEASLAYRTILELCVRHIGAVIGFPLTEEVLCRVTGQVDSASSQLLQAYRVFPATAGETRFEED